ncbi:hypothetical protein [Helicobacter sp. L8]|uniref:hypothetical protein n=1 Tax=Helicobacter sp. L8 TaxID=2316078 RepID=UPI000EADDE80|nr:hypothetical protein [Helicobacter sp. L8]
MKITLNTPKIVENFGNLSLFAKAYSIKVSILNYHQRNDKASHFRKKEVFQAFKQMQADGYLTIEYHNDN